MTIKEIKEKRNMLENEIEELESMEQDLGNARTDLDGAYSTIEWMNSVDNICFDDVEVYIERAIEELEEQQNNVECELSAKRDELGGLPEVDDYYTFDELRGNALLKAIVEVKNNICNDTLPFENLSIRRIHLLAEVKAFNEDGNIVEMEL